MQPDPTRCYGCRGPLPADPLDADARRYCRAERCRLTWWRDAGADRPRLTPWWER